MMMWFLFLLFITRTELVILQGSPGGDSRLVLKGENPCEGHIEIYHNGVMGYVGHTYWDSNIEKVVCRSAHCGDPIKTEDIFRPENRTVWLNDISCQGHESHLWECDFPGWGVPPYQGKYVKKITCSHEIEISLDGQSCAGAVQYSLKTSDSSTSDKRGYFCSDTWGEAEANLVCAKVGCGSAKEASYNEMTRWTDFENSQKTMLDCSGITDYKNLWQCVTAVSTPQCKKRVSVKCTGHQRLQLKKEANILNACHGHLQKEENGRWIPFNNASYDKAACHQMHCGGSDNYTPHNQGLLLTCKDNVSVVLMDSNPSSCYGAVHVKVNKDHHPVCGSTWTSKDAQVVCSELNCGKVVFSNSLRQSGRGIMENVKCSGTESSLWHCGAKRDKDLGFPCSNIAYVACSESVNVRLMDGPGRCAGRVEIHYEGKWWRIREEGWTNINSETVCKQRNCGSQRSSRERFGQGSGGFLPKTVECQQGAKNISECTMKESNVRGGGGFQDNQAKAVSITCEEHKVVFLENTCSGKVGIAHGDKSFWLSGNDSNTWNNETADVVCRQMHCGKALDWSSVPGADLKDIWTNVYNCEPNSESLFGCNATELPEDHNETAIATVKCSESLTMKLAKGCWGRVDVCMGEKCGGVCQDSWTDEKSKMLCKELGCGDKILRAYKKPDKTNVIFTSLHTTKQTKNLTECNFVRNNETEPACEPAYVICSGSARSQFDAFSSKSNCSGNVEVFYEGQFLPVCSKALTPKAQNLICEELKCGQAVKTLDYFGLRSEKAAISQIQCPENAKSLKACDITRAEDNCPLSGLQCSKWKKVELNFGKKACSGDVFVKSKEGIKAVPAGGWTNEMGRTLCKDLNCGDFIKFHNSSGSHPFWNGTFSCQDGEKPENIWKCVKAQQSSQKLQLSVECQDPNVTLSGECHGEVRINNTLVCSSNWRDIYSNKLCEEKSCGSIALFHETGNRNRKDPMYHVSYDQCDRLGKCNRYKDTCANGPLSVYCVRNVEFNTTEKCGGQIEIIYQDRREKLCAFPDKFQDKLCRAIGCDGFNSVLMKKVLKEKSQREKAKKLNLQKTVDCGPEYMDYKYCVKSGPCEKEPAEIYCKGYNLPIIEPPPPPPPLVPIIVGIGLILVLVILIAVFARLYIVRRARRAKMASRMYSRNEVEFESGDYEDVSNKANEMEDFSDGNFRRDAEVFMESDARSNTSVPYDDIDEAVETRLLTSPAATKAGSYFEDDGVTYEVDDPQENYDDIEPDPEVTETKAEVHASPETTPESVSAAPPGRAQGDEDYLVPGQDG